MTGDRLGRQLAAARRRGFVGRSGELELFRAALTSDSESSGSFAVLFVYGPGGIGKTALLEAFAELAADVGVPCARLDARAVWPAVDALSSAVAQLDAGPAVLLLDTLEAAAGLEDWIREEFAPGLASGALLVLAGRQPPSPRWTADPAWRDLLRVVSMRNLTRTESRDLLDRKGLPTRLHEKAVDLASGHPLSLALLADAQNRNGWDDLPAELSDSPDLVAVLLDCILDEVPDARHRLALEVVAHARYTTEGLLRSVLGDADASELFAWLSGLSFIQRGRRGLHPHDLARRALDASLRWRDPDGYADLHRRIRAHLLSSMSMPATSVERQERSADLVFLVRSHPVTGPYWHWAALGGGRIVALRAEDTPELIDLCHTVQGAQQAELAAHWAARQPAAFRVFRSASGELLGFAAYLALHDASADDLAADPGASALWSYASRHDPPRTAEPVMAWRFLVGQPDEEPVKGTPRLIDTMLGVCSGLEILSGRACSWDFVAVHTDADYWAPFFAHYDFHRVPEADYTIGGVRFVVFAHDWRQVGLEAWLDLTEAHELGAEPAQPDPADQTVVLSQPDFVSAVRAALRDLHRPDLLSGNPLLRSRLVRDIAGDEPPAASLGALIAQAVDAVGGDARSEQLKQVLVRTFLRPAPTQEAAAEVLGLPFSTYRRYRDRGIERLTAWLWNRELHGSE